MGVAPESMLVADAPTVGRRAARIAFWLGALALAALVCQLPGIDLRGWIANLWDAMTEVSAGYLVLGLGLQTLQTGLTALAWVAILRAAYPSAVLPAASDRHLLRGGGRHERAFCPPTSAPSPCSSCSWASWRARRSRESSPATSCTRSPSPSRAGRVSHGGESKAGDAPCRPFPAGLAFAS